MAIRVSEYCTVLAQCLSPDGAFLAVADADVVNVFKLESVLNKEKTAKTVRIRFETQVLSLTSTFSDFLIVGGVSKISAFRWDDIEKAEAEETFSFRLKDDVDVNSATFLNAEAHLILGGGDNRVHVVDLETRTLLRSLDGHENFVHAVDAKSAAGIIVSGSEDGTVRTWDVRRKSALNAVIKPGENSNLKQPKLGTWVGDVSLSHDGDWLVCGGGVKSALWHTKTMTMTRLLLEDNENDFGVHVCKIIDEDNEGRVVVAGATRKAFQVDLASGSLLSEVATSSSVTYSMAWTWKPVNVLALAGSSSKVDVCSPNFSYKCKVFDFYD